MLAANESDAAYVLWEKFVHRPQDQPGLYDVFKAVPRKDVTVEYVEAATTRSVPLADADGLNEFNVVERHPGKSTFYKHAMSQEYPKDVLPTDLSKAAVRYNAARAKVGSGITGPKWTAKSVDELKKTCDAQSELVNRLKAPDTGSAGAELKIGVRLDSLADGLKSAADLIERAP